MSEETQALRRQQTTEAHETQREARPARTEGKRVATVPDDAPHTPPASGQVTSKPRGNKRKAKVTTTV